MKFSRESKPGFIFRAFFHETVSELEIFKLQPICTLTTKATDGSKQSLCCSIICRLTLMQSFLFSFK